MSKQQFIPIKEFCTKYELCQNSITVRKSTGKLPKHIFRKDKTGVSVDENYFIRFWDFQHSIIETNRIFYKYLLKHTHQARISKLVHRKYPTTSSDTLVQYFIAGLVKDQTNLGIVRINKITWVFNKWVRLTMRSLDITIEELSDELYK